jgi:hypothetical protein
MRDNKVPLHFGKRLLEKYRGYGESEEHKQSFRYFASRILPAVNASYTKFDRSKYSKLLNECFSYTDEAFGLLLVVSYEQRWISQHEAMVMFPDETRKEREARSNNALYTSSTEGSRRGQSWDKKGLLKFNSLCEMVKEQRAADTMGDKIEEDLRQWCREQAGMPMWGKGDRVNPQVQDSVGPAESEVEAIGECDIYQV